MKNLKHYTIAGIIFVAVTGTLAHFLFDWSDQNPIVGFFTPVNESVWEHMKLLFFPMLLYAFVFIFHFRPDYPCIVSSLCFGILTGTVLIPFFYYIYTYFLGTNFLILDIGIFLLSIIIAFWLSYRLSSSCRLDSYRILLCISVFLLFICFLFFTYHAPDCTIFQE